MRLIGCAGNREEIGKILVGIDAVAVSRVADSRLSKRMEGLLTRPGMAETHAQTPFRGSNPRIR